MKHLLLIFLAALAGVVGCSKKESDPAPAALATAAFDTSRQVVEPDEPVETTNTSTEAVSYEWKTDDGQTSRLATPRFTFPYPGSYAITLKAYNKDGVANTVSHAVTVGNRYFRLIEVLAVPFTTPAGQPWSATGGPNLRLVFGSLTGPSGGMTAVTLNLTLASLPLGYTTAFSYGNPFTLTSGFVLKTPYQFVLQHINNPNDPVNATVMENLQTNLSAPSANRDKNGNGWYELANAAGTARLRVHYETRIR